MDQDFRIPMQVCPDLGLEKDFESSTDRGQ